MRSHAISTFAVNLSLQRQTSMVRPSRRTSSSSFASQAVSPSKTNGAPKTVAGTKLTRQLLLEHSPQADILPGAFAPDPSSSPVKPSASSLDFLPQPAMHRQNVVSRHSAVPQSPHTPQAAAGLAGQAASPGWTSHGQFFFGQVPHSRHATSSAKSRGSSEGTGSTISVDKPSSDGKRERESVWIR